MGNASEGFVEDSEMSDQSIVAVKIKGGSYLLCDLLNGKLFTVKLTLLVFEKMHKASPDPGHRVTGSLAGR
jgi:hypothetical protein